LLFLALRAARRWAPSGSGLQAVFYWPPRPSWHASSEQRAESDNADDESLESDNADDESLESDNADDESLEEAE
jgi:hypothetical protein